MVVFRFLLLGLAPVEDPEALALVCRLEEDILLLKISFQSRPRDFEFRIDGKTEKEID